MRYRGLLAVAASWGVFWGGWAALIPGLQDALGLTDRQLGLALFAVPVAAVPAMVLTGRVVAVLGRWALPAVTTLLAVGALLAAVAPNFGVFTVALLVVGAGSGGIEVALNAATAAREAADDVRLFNKVHAATPLAMVLSAPAAGLCRRLGASPGWVLAVIAVLVLASAALAVDRSAPEPAADEPEEKPGLRAVLTGALLVAGLLSAAVLFSENAVEQWGAIHLGEAFHAGPLLASFAPAAYMVGLFLGRTAAQQLGDRIPDRTLIAAGAALGAIGLALGAAAISTVLTLVGFTLAGIGLAPIMPTLMGMVGRSVPASRRPAAIAAVTTISYAGFLSSPPLVGALAGALTLRTALFAVAAVPLAVLLSSRFVARDRVPA